MFKRGRWVKLVHDLVQNGEVLEPAGAVGIVYGYHQVKNPETEELRVMIVVHLVSFPDGETRAAVLLPDDGIELVISKSELPPTRVQHLPDDWRPVKE